MLRRGAPFLAGLLTGLLSTALLLLLTSEPRGTPIELKEPPTAQPLQVHVAGAVVRPGVYELAPGAIVQDAVHAAGGAEQDALLSDINLAQALQNGMRIYIPAEGESARSELPGELISTPGTSGASETLRINEASIAELEQLPGIGPSLASAIIQYRDENGPFQTKDELQDVPGIGPAKLSAIEDLIEVP